MNHDFTFARLFQLTQPYDLAQRKETEFMPGITLGVIKSAAGVILSNSVSILTKFICTIVIILTKKIKHCRT